MSEDSKEVTKKEERSVEYTPLGADDKMRLTLGMVKNFIAVPTKSGKLPSEKDCMKFIMMCMGKRANPFEGDAFLIGYDGKDGAVFSLICGIELFMKRAENADGYNGKESGIVVKPGDGEMIERPGTILLQGEKLIGGWAKVYRSDREYCDYKTVNFSVYDTGYSRWKADPCGMIEKVALSQALRGAFPIVLGGLYTEMEMEGLGDKDVGLNLSDEKPKLKETKEIKPEPDNKPGLQEEIAEALK